MTPTRHLVRLLAALLTTVLGAALLTALPAQAAGTATVSGVVRDQDGQPLAGVNVNYRLPGQSPASMVTTQDDGTYSIGALEPGTYTFQVDKLSDAGPGELRDSYTSAETQLVVGAGSTTANYDFTLTKRGRISFHVTGSDGQPSLFVSLAVRQSKDGGATWEERYEGQNTTQSQGLVQITPEPGYLYKFHFYPPNKQFAEEQLHETYDPVADEWWDDARSEATATILGTSAEGEVLPTYEVQLDRRVSGTPPTIAGSPTPGSTLTATTGNWYPDGHTKTWQWFASGVAIPGATGTTFAVTNAQAGKTITVRATGTFEASTETYESAPTSPVVGTITRRAVKIKGTARVGKKLTASTSAWSPKPVRLTYTWYRNGKKISGQTKRTYKLRNADKGRRITVRVTGTRSGYATTTLLSAKTSKVKKKR